MKIDIEHVARLARLGLSDREKELFSKQLGNILNYAENLNKLDIKNIEPSSHAISMKNIMREDVVEKCEDIDPILANGPDVEDGMFKVPRIIE